VAADIGTLGCAHAIADFRVLRKLKKHALPVHLLDGLAVGDALYVHICANHAGCSYYLHELLRAWLLDS
jgi:hypothetical protein